MKKLTLILVAILIAGTGVMAQTPNQFKYQAVLRDASGNILANQSVTVDISILQGSASGTSVFTEQHTVNTTAQGLINLNIGSVEDLSVVDFSTDTYFIKISVNSTVMGTSQLLSVPYALQAKEVENVDYSQITNTPTLFDGNYNSLTHLPTLFNGSYNSLTDLPTLFDGNYNSLTNLPILFDGSYNSLTDLPTLFSKNYNDLTNVPWIMNGDKIFYTGNVGIGEKSLADSKLDVVGSGSLPVGVFWNVFLDDNPVDNSSGVTGYIIKASGNTYGVGSLGYYNSAYNILGTGVFGNSGNLGAYGVYGRYSASNYGYLGSNGIGVYGIGTLWAGYFDGNLYANGNVGIGTTAPSSKLQVIGLPEYADNTAALAGGLTVGAFYRTGDLLKVVH